MPVDIEVLGHIDIPGNIDVTDDIEVPDDIDVLGNIEMPDSVGIRGNLEQLPGYDSLGSDLAGDIDLDNVSIFNSEHAVQFPGAPLEVNDKNIDDMIETYSPLVIDCWKIACSPCKSMDLTINELALDYKGQIAFGKLCINRNAATAKKYGLTRAPTLLIFNNGTLVYRHLGNYPKERVEEIILTALRMR